MHTISGFTVGKLNDLPRQQVFFYLVGAILKKINLQKSTCLKTMGELVQLGESTPKIIMYIIISTFPGDAKNCTYFHFPFFILSYLNCVNQHFSTDPSVYNVSRNCLSCTLDRHGHPNRIHPNILRILPFGFQKIPSIQG